MTSIVAPFQIGVDTGGTFTDVVVRDRDGEIVFDKSPTTLERAYTAVGNALDEIGVRTGTSRQDLLAGTDLFVYGTTRATNVVVERKSARTALFTTSGFPDILALREGGKLSPFDFSVAVPEPLVPAPLTFEIPGRIDAQGTEIEPLDRRAVTAAIAAARAAGAEAIAVCLLWSIANPSHEQAIGRLIEEAAPELAVTLSHEVNPIIREYRRASSTALDASLKPIMQHHLAELERDLTAAGFGGRLLVVTATGGCVSAQEAAAKPLRCVNSGPAMAPVAARLHAAECDFDDDLVVCDTGGTSFDISLIRDGELATTRETWLGGSWQGDITGLSSVEVTSIGAGGGSIAWIDDGGLLRVGPQSAGARPGPACYARGGTAPTVTDAALALGYLNPDRFLGGRMRLDEEAARQALTTQVAAPLGLSLDRAAQAVLTVANTAMVAAISEITINQGVDPRLCTMVVGGGAGGLSGAALAQRLGCQRVLVPATAGALSADGAVHSDIVKEFVTGANAVTREFDFERAGAAFARLDAEASDFLASLPDELLAEVEISYSAEGRYPDQVWELEFPVARPPVDEQDVRQIEAGFHAAHERTFAVSQPGEGVEIQLWKARATGKLARPAIADAPVVGVGRALPESRSVFFEASARTEAAIHTPETVPPGVSVEGPSVIEARTTTIVIPPACTCSRTAAGHYLIETRADRP